MRMLRRLVILAAVLWVVVEVAAIPFANQTIQNRVAAKTQGVGAVHAKVGSFPVVARLILTGEVKSVTVTLDQVVRQKLTFTQVRFDMSGIEIDRSGLLDQNAKVTAIHEGTITATLDLGALGRSLGRLAVLGGRGVRMEGTRLFLGRASVQVTSDVLPCSPQARVEGDQVLLSCTIHEVPQILLEGAQR